MDSRIKFSPKSNEAMGTLDSSPLEQKQRLRSRDAKPLAQSHQAVKLGPTGVNRTLLGGLGSDASPPGAAP